jgi:hypothetical protein
VPTFAQNLFLARVSEICILHTKNNCFLRIGPPGATPAPVQRSIQFCTDFLRLFVAGLAQFCSPFGLTFPCPAGTQFLINSWGLVPAAPATHRKSLKNKFAGKVHPLAYLGVPLGPHVAYIGLQPVAWKPLRLDLDAYWATKSSKNQMFAKAVGLPQEGSSRCQRNRDDRHIN